MLLVAVFFIISQAQLKSMKKLIIKLFDKVILLILGSSAVLYSCYKYGMPVDEFEIKGVVTDSKNVPIQNIRVVKPDSDTLYTQSDGKYFFHLWEEKFSPIKIKVEDIDGEENGGEFRPYQFDVEFTEADMVKKGTKNNPGDKYVITRDIKLYRTDEYPPIAYGPPQAPFKP
jgi:putative lipoprotein (rSAM/lipoprotein system)